MNQTAGPSTRRDFAEVSQRCAAGVYEQETVPGEFSQLVIAGGDLRRLAFGEASCSFLKQPL